MPQSILTPAYKTTNHAIVHNFNSNNVLKSNHTDNLEYCMSCGVMDSHNQSNGDKEKNIYKLSKPRTSSTSIYGRLL